LEKFKRQQTLAIIAKIGKKEDNDDTRAKYKGEKKKKRQSHCSTKRKTNKIQKFLDSLRAVAGTSLPSTNLQVELTLFKITPLFKKLI
jgi:hypothetical protein